MRKTDIFDHFPIWIKAGIGDWGPKSFRFNNYWVKHKDFLSFVKEEWDVVSVIGQGDFILKENLKALKRKLKWWNKKVFGWLDLKVEKVVSDLNSLDVDCVVLAEFLL